VGLPHPSFHAVDSLCVSSPGSVWSSAQKSNDLAPFNEGKLRTGATNNIYDSLGYPIVSVGHILGDYRDPIVHSGDNVHDPRKRYRITITATQDGHNKEWKGRIFEAASQGGWNFVVVATKNESNASNIGEGDLVVTVTVTNPSGDQSPPHTPPSPVTVASIP
jgi:hypothetical protein